MAGRHFLTVMALAAVGTALLASCGGSDPNGNELVFPSATHSPSPPVTATVEDQRVSGVLGPYDTGVGRNGAEVSILSVADEVTNYGPAIGFHLPDFQRRGSDHRRVGVERSHPGLRAGRSTC